MKNQDIVFLANRGILAATNHSLNATDGYQFYKFKKSLNKAFIEIGESERELLKEAGIEDMPEVFNARMDALKGNPERTTEEDREMQSMIGKSMAYAKMREALYEEEAKLATVIPLTYEAWRMLQDENKSVSLGNVTVDVFSGPTEEILEGILWAAPEE